MPRELSWRKKLLFSGVILFGTGSLFFPVAEIGYRIRHAIPLIGGRVYESELRIREEALRAEPWNANFLNRFRPSENRLLFYEPRPGYDDGVYRINSQGFRDREFSTEKPQGVFRIVTLGDSIIWGHGLPNGQTYAKQLESILNERLATTFEVLNFGVSGYSTQQEVELFRARARAYHPDMVIIGYCLNDYKESSVEGQAFKQLYYDIFSKSYLFEALKQRFRGAAFKAWGTTKTEVQIQHDLHEQFALLKSYAGEIPVVLVVFPALIDFHAYTMFVDHYLVARAIQDLDIERIDLLQPFSRHEVGELLQNDWDDTHPNTYGTAIAAQATFEQLLRQGLIPSAR